MRLPKITVTGIPVLLALLSVVGCESDADRIREINQSLRSPTATAPLEARVGALELVEGDCIKSTIPEEITIETIVIVPCDDEWQYRVLNSFDAVGKRPF